MDGAVMENPERAKYERLWADHPDYRINSPGELVLLQWLKAVKPLPRASIIDFGCGPGRASMVMGLMGFNVTMVDIAENCLDPDVRGLVDAGRLRFVRADLTAPGAWDLEPADIGYCCDVMEHLPTEHVEPVIAAIVGLVKDAFFLVNFREDGFGKDIGEPLHLTVQPFPWWLDVFRRHGNVVDARDLIANGMFRVTR